jgi:hypothetical protein
MSEIKEKTLGLMETMVKQNGDMLVMASRIKDPSERKKLLDRLDKQIDRSRNLLKELK